MAFFKVYWLRYRRLFFICILFLSIEAFCDLTQPTIVSKIIDEGVKAGDLQLVLRLAGLMIGVTLTGAVGAVVRNQLASRVSQHFGADLRSDLFKKINGYSFEQLGNYEAATLITRITNDSGQLQNFCNGMMRIFVKAPILLIGAFIMVLLLNFRMALVLVVVIPIIIALMAASMKFGYPHFAKLQKMIDRMNSVTREYLSGVRVVKAFNTFDFEVNRYTEANTLLTGTAIKANRIMSVFTPLITLAVNMGIVALLWNARSLINMDLLKIGQVVAFINYMGQILQSLNMIFNVYQQFIRAKASVDRVGEIIGSKPGEREEGAQKREIQGEIKFVDVNFKYPSAGAPTLSDINISIQACETIGIIGSTGAGKTALINLIPGFYAPTSGAVLLDGEDISGFDLNHLRGQISLVSQKARLFTGTIAENISYGAPDATREEIEHAAKAACAHDFIMSFPAKYDTLVGQNGVNLSGGQKQRISIARALIRRSKILILDDCVSAVDVNTEAIIMSALQEISGGLTCVIISQRISTVKNLKKIIVMDDGRIVGTGTHDELIESCEVYSEISRSQLGKARDEIA